MATCTGLALCAGVGGLELGASLALGDRYRTVGYVERESYAASVLVARMEEQALHRAPVWDDLASFDGNRWRGKVDLITAGFPCQPFSQAGTHKGTADAQWVWPDIARIIGEVRPQAAFFENVPPLATKGLDLVLTDLASLGLDAEWGNLSAADLGAPHIRRRIWIYAYEPGFDLLAYTSREGPWTDASQDGGTQREMGTDMHHVPSGSRQDVAHAADERHQRGRLLGHFAGHGSIFPPTPDDLDGWVSVIRAGGPKPAVLRVADGLAHRLDRLHVIGNGVVPMVAAQALVCLAQRAQRKERH